MTTTSPQPPCTCRPYPAGHHGIILHADQVDDLAGLLTTTEHWLLNATSDVHLNLHQFLTTTRPDPARQHLLDQVDDLINRLTTTSQDWLHHADDTPDSPGPPANQPRRRPRRPAGPHPSPPTPNQQSALPIRTHRTLPAHVHTAWPATTGWSARSAARLRGVRRRVRRAAAGCVGAG